jgi:hypothetical protein
MRTSFKNRVVLKPWMNFEDTLYYTGEDKSVAITFSTADQFNHIVRVTISIWGTALQAGRSRVRFPDEVIGICYWFHSSGRTMAFRSTQSRTEMATRDISWVVKAAGEQGWQHATFTCWMSKIPARPELLKLSGRVQTCSGIAFMRIEVFSEQKFKSSEIWRGVA